MLFIAKFGEMKIEHSVIEFKWAFRIRAKVFKFIEDKLNWLKLPRAGQQVAWLPKSLMDTDQNRQIDQPRQRIMIDGAVLAYFGIWREIKYRKKLSSFYTVFMLMFVSRWSNNWDKLK